MIKKRVLICANPDLNYIDGSSIWAQTICLAVAATDVAHVDFIAKSTPRRDELFRPLLDDVRVNVIDGTDKQYWDNKDYRQLNSQQLADLAVFLERIKSYDVIIVRGLEIAQALLECPSALGKCWLYLTDIPQAVDEYSLAQRQLMTQLAGGAAKILCQSRGFMALWQKLVPNFPADKLALYSPVIPDLMTTCTAIANRKRKAVYAGKYKCEWKTLEMAELWPEVHRQVSDSELLMIGDKIHNESVPENYMQRMRDALEHTAGLRWVGALSRERVQAELLDSRVGLSWRAESMNDTLEYSTKILEYGGAGCAAILNRNQLHVELLGNDYPLYANSTEEFKSQLRRALVDDHVVEDAARRLRELAERHTFSSCVATIKTWLNQTSTASAGFSPDEKRNEETRILIAGHDLKFFASLKDELASFGFTFLEDKWLGHNCHDEEKSRELLNGADIIFCEWCLGNLKWYSHNKRPDQKLFARFHAQERKLTYLEEANWSNIDQIIFVSEHMRRDAQRKFGFPADKSIVIPNLLNDEKFTPIRKSGDSPFTIGMIGIVPAAKRLDRAIDLLEELLKKDDRYCLRVKGKHPLDYDWLLNREEEVSYYKKIYKRINSSPTLRYKVIFDPAGDDVNTWLSLVGFILSPSDAESFHLAVGEGMLSGCFPIVWNWDGADNIWPESSLVATVSDAAEKITKLSRCFDSSSLKNNRGYVVERYSSIKVVPNIISLLSGTV